MTSRLLKIKCVSADYTGRIVEMEFSLLTT
nr:MAG TPA: hypothetical protein [Caudoviricetes sp.]